MRRLISRRDAALGGKDDERSIAGHHARRDLRRTDGRRTQSRIAHPADEHRPPGRAARGGRIAAGGLLPPWRWRSVRGVTEFDRLMAEDSGAVFDAALLDSILPLVPGLPDH